MLLLYPWLVNHNIATRVRLRTAPVVRPSLPVEKQHSAIYLSWPHKAPQQNCQFVKVDES